MVATENRREPGNPEVRLRPLERSDLDFLVELGNDPVVRENVVGWGWPLSRSGQERWFESTLSDQSTKRFIVEDSEGDRIGVTILSDISWRDGTAAVAIKLGGAKLPRGKGLGTAALKATMDFAFQDAGLRRLHARILVTNVASQRIFEKCGWQVEGILREHVRKGGTHVDVLQVGTLDGLGQ